MNYYICLLLTALFATAAPAADRKKKKRPAPVVSPTIHDDNSVTFRIEAKNAEKVQVSGEMVKGNVALEKNDKGIWETTLEPMEPGLYGYSFIVDGVKMLDPGNPQLKPMRSPKTSILHIAGDHAYDWKDVPHGTVHTHNYHSKPINRFREMRVYTPPGYETGTGSYPLLVLQHGHSDSFATWTTYGKAHWILDNLIAEGKAVPMIVLMTDGHPIPGSYGNGRSPENTEELRADLLDAAIPMVEKLYRVKKGRENRAITGLSMGGLHAITIGLNEPDSFSAIGAFSAAIPEFDALGDALEVSDKNPDLFWIAIGKEDFLLEENEAFIEKIKETGLPHQWLLTEGGHSWPIWRDYLEQFLPLLSKHFKSAG